MFISFTTSHNKCSSPAANVHITPASFRQLSSIQTLKRNRESEVFNFVKKLTEEFSPLKKHGSSFLAGIITEFSCVFLCFLAKSIYVDSPRSVSSSVNWAFICIIIVISILLAIVKIWQNIVCLLIENRKMFQFIITITKQEAHGPYHLTEQTISISDLTLTWVDNITQTPLCHLHHIFLYPYFHQKIFSSNWSLKFHPFPLKFKLLIPPVWSICLHKNLLPQCPLHHKSHLPLPPPLLPLSSSLLPLPPPPHLPDLPLFSPVPVYLNIFILDHH